MTRTQDSEVPVSPHGDTRLASSGIVRRATVADIDALIEMGKSFLSYSKYGQAVPFDHDQMAKGLCGVIDHGVIFVAEKHGEIIGGLVGARSQMWFAPDTLIASELAWWVKPEHRGSKLSIRLLHEFERWGKANGAKLIAMSDLVIDGDNPAGRLIEKLGYALVERAHVKGV